MFYWYQFTEKIKEMELFREEYLSVQEDDLSMDPAKETSYEGNNGANYSLDENTEPIPMVEPEKEDQIYNLSVDPDDEDDLLDDDDDDDDFDADSLPDLDDDELVEDDDVFVDETPASPLTNDGDFVVRHPERRTGRGVSDEPGLPGLDRSL